MARPKYRRTDADGQQVKGRAESTLNVGYDYGVEFIRYIDGALAFSDAGDSEHFIYLYPAQIAHLRRFLRETA